MQSNSAEKTCWPTCHESSFKASDGGGEGAASGGYGLMTTEETNLSAKV